MPALKHRELKASMIDDGTFKEFLQFRQKLYMLGADPDDRESYIGYTDEELDALFQLKQQRYVRRSKLNKWFDYWMKQKDKQLYFITFKFNKEAMKDSDQTRKMYVYRNIEAYDDYCLNIDYGEKTGRLHYHCVLVLDKVADELMDWKWSKRWHTWYCNDCVLFNDKKGHIDVRKVDYEDPDALKAYQGKLTSHSLKSNGTKLGFKKKSRFQDFIAYQKMINGVIRYQAKKRK